MKTLITSTLAVAAIASVAVAAAPTKDIVDIAAGDSNFSTLVSLVKQAGLVDTLKSEGPFTVFAPTNDAFAKLPKATVDAVVSDKALLTNVLLYHVVPGKVTAHQVIDAAPLKAKTALKVNNAAQTLDIKVVNGKVRINNVNVIKTDIMAKNGVIHVIDGVLVPPAAGTQAKASNTVVHTSTCGG
ncbi:MAG TPA: fasciclin domain-containing protein [Fimbriimonadaceae bacterium]|nr:Nex18 symbiotically induced protein [Armatimonadota bacterium]HCM73898.1 Nex18 symbiotically induced protein [Armatimonadota bacterium]HRD30915.1 fasciclin domain-containing protein [Fimbriimonadaceae bacterium]HRE94156.1 fasciclin domain-containing protein [Fimbriimonadaceae bacterium]HRI74718.1 fasciclin domain-containing protein [Fimbriimonadaceae bacterium]